MADVKRFVRVLGGPEADRRARRLRAKFAAIRIPSSRAIRYGGVSRSGLLSLLIAAGVFVTVATGLVLSPYPPFDTLRHLLAVPNCDAARAVGLAPARRGEPGYWPNHDADNDGVACEPWSR